MVRNTRPSLIPSSTLNFYRCTNRRYGLNTAGGFPFIFGIIYGVYFANPAVCTEETCTADEILAEESDRVTLAWQVCVSANFITGLINIFLGFFGEILLKLFPVAAMLVPIAGIGFTWLALNQIGPNFETPAIGLIPVFLIFTQYYGRGTLRIGGYALPEAVPIVIFGTIAGWLYGLNDTVVDAVSPGVSRQHPFVTQVDPSLLSLLILSLAI